VFLEPLGYIGFYSQLKMLDFPGLSSREVVEARKRTSTDRAAALIRELQPDWLVLRSQEVRIITEADPTLLTHTYSLAKTFDASRSVTSLEWLPGRNYLVIDQTYVVFRRGAEVLRPRAQHRTD
jgi:hypothetical protein